jgi:8-oxo-dGTP diphosphatase
MIEHDVSYLPLPNHVEIVFSDQTSPPELTRTAFMIPVFPDGSVLMAVNQRRGIEIPGGHREGDETLLQAAIREVREEAGCSVRDPIPVGYLHMVSRGEVPEGWKYPHPEGYQQFYAGMVDEQFVFDVNDECSQPLRVHDLSMLRQRSRFLCEQAVRVLLPK